LRSPALDRAADDNDLQIERLRPNANTKAAAALRVVALSDEGIATAGNYRYYFDYNGRRYSHRIDRARRSPSHIRSPRLP
jgi:thiamine biosynthesis lipoprotein ApbE